MESVEMSNKEKMQSIKVDWNSLKMKSSEPAVEESEELDLNKAIENANEFTNENIEPETLERLKDLAKGGEFAVLIGFVKRTKELFAKYPETRTEKNEKYIAELETLFSKALLESRPVVREIANNIKMFVFINTASEQAKSGRISKELSEKIVEHYEEICAKIHDLIRAILNSIDYDNFDKTLEIFESTYRDSSRKLSIEISEILELVEKESTVTRDHTNDILELLVYEYNKVKESNSKKEEEDSKIQMTAMQLLSVFSSFNIQKDFRKNPVGRKIITKYWPGSKINIPRKLDLDKVFALTMNIAKELHSENKSIIDWAKENNLPKQSVKALILDNSDYDQIRSQNNAEEVIQNIESEQQDLKDYYASL